MTYLLIAILGILLGSFAGWRGAWASAKREQIQREALAAREQALREENTRLQEETLRHEADGLREQLAEVKQLLAKEKAESPQRWNEYLATAQLQLKNTTQQLLEEREKHLASTNTQQLGSILTPLKESICEMKQAMEQTKETNIRHTASLKEQIEQLARRTQEIGQEANQLATALRGESKTQGNWGELVLTELLAGQGLTEGTHFDTQKSLRDTEGRKFIPDVVLHYPDQKDVIIDSKVSLTAFVDYRNATDEAEKADALVRHLKSVRAHVNELVTKKYASYIKPPRQALDYVIMFVPNEGALQLALINDATLWRKAFEHSVFICGEQNLIAILRMIEVAWTQKLQIDRHQEIYSLAEILLDRVALLWERFQKFGDKLLQAQKSYDDCERLFTGNQSIGKAAQKLVELGAKPSKALPNLSNEDKRES